MSKEQRSGLLKRVNFILSLIVARYVGESFISNAQERFNESLDIDKSLCAVCGDLQSEIKGFNLHFGRVHGKLHAVMWGFTQIQDHDLTQLIKLRQKLVRCSHINRKRAERDRRAAQIEQALKQGKPTEKVKTVSLSAEQIAIGSESDFEDQ